MTISPALLAKLCKLYRLRDGANDEQILLAAEQAAAATGALEKLQALFGSADTQALLADAQKAIEAAEKAKPLVEALNAAQQRLGEYDKQAAEGEVEQIAAAMRLNEEQAKRFKPLLLAERLACANDPAKLQAFRAQYPLPTAQQQMLTQSIVAGPNGTQLGGPQTGVSFSATSQSHQSVHPATTYPGRNEIEKCMAYLSDKRPGFKALSRLEQVNEAGNYLRAGAPVL